MNWCVEPVGYIWAVDNEKKKLYLINWSKTIKDEEELVDIFDQ